jgi:hypothetical protein
VRPGRLRSDAAVGRTLSERTPQWCGCGRSIAKMRRCGSPINRSTATGTCHRAKVFDASIFHHLRTDRPIQRPRGKKRSHRRGQIQNVGSIRERPVEPDAREVAGHWECDLVFGARPSAVASLTDDDLTTTSTTIAPAATPTLPKRQHRACSRFLPSPGSGCHRLNCRATATSGCWRGAVWSCWRRPQLVFYSPFMVEKVRESAGIMSG